MRLTRWLRATPTVIGGPAGSPDGLDEPIVAELFSIERLEQHAGSLAAAQAVIPDPRRGRALGPRVTQDGAVLLAAYRTLGRAIKEERSITPAAEWLVDNFHVVDEQLREIHDDLPPDYYRELPKLAGGHLEGFPRVVGLAWAYVAHTDSRFDADSLRRFVAAYQRVEPLTIGELWAVAISLRVVLVENLRRLAELIVRGREARQAANRLADGLLGLDDDRPRITEASFRRLAGSALPTTGQVQLFQRLRDHDPAVTPALGWLEGLVAEQGTSVEEVVRVEHQRQAAMNVTVRNVITSMRVISWFDWPDFVEGLSLVDAVLREGDSFGGMDFATRDRYRHAIETLARRSGRTEVDVAREALDLATRPDGGGQADTTRGANDDLAALTGRRHDPGYYLVAHGRPLLEQVLECPVPPIERLRRAVMRRATPVYLGTLALATAVILALPLWASAADGTSLPALLVLAIAALVPASGVAIAVIDWLVTHLVGPRSLPRLDLAGGVPSELRTLVVIPTLLADDAHIESLVSLLEVHFLANPDGDLRFALLTDWLDAPSERVPGDEALLATAGAGVDRLNARHGEAPGGGARFLLFHRERRWNAAQGVWMGWERKRGKLHELNALLRGSSSTSILRTGRASSVPPPGVHYVITLDSDTRLPRGAAARLVGTMAHPLNRPVFDARAGRVVDGHAILQPRVTTTLPVEREASLFQRITSRSAGIDPYASAVSDVYQDLFGEGTYTGKGIYDLDLFERALVDRSPENTLLSHDLLEGTFARAGLATDIELFDETPSRYEEASARQHRWARGDWQLLPWILGRAHGATGRPSDIPWIARWKMIDNLRRTLVAPAALMTLVAAWTVPTAPTVAWTGLVLVSMLVPALLPVLPGLLPRRKGISKRSHLRAVATDLALAAAHVGLGVVFLADQAVRMLDAVVRTLVRVYVTRRDLLEWMTAAHAKGRHDLDLPGFYRSMAVAVAVAVACGVLVLILEPSAGIVAAPFVALWLLSPMVARWVGLTPRDSTDHGLSDADTRTLRLVGRRTWRYFETFVGPQDNALPPDNFQEDPGPVVAHRTSPTNIGMYLLSVVTARDLGWIGSCEMAERLTATLTTIARLDRVRGHLYNWYDTRDLRPLEPAYVSTVDSGNLCGHLIVVANACREMLDQPLPIDAARAGIDDAIVLARRAAAAIRDEPSSKSVSRRDVDDALEAVATSLAVAPATPGAWGELLTTLATQTRTLVDVARAFMADRADAEPDELVTWAEAAERAVASHARDFETAPSTLGSSLEAIAEEAQLRFRETEFRFLFVPTRKLFSIGFRVRDGTLDPDCYDLLASEARLASFLAIAKGEVEASHWFRLGRPLTPTGRGSALVSWSGSMFEYLMPALVMRAPWLSLLGHTYRLVVARQIGYARERGVPWGISESAFNVRDLEGTYQYSSFGVPGLGLKRGLGDDLVIAPYASALGAMVEPEAAVRNLGHLVAAGAAGPYGFREALDYTRRRLPDGVSVAVVNSYMAHHQGMALVAIGNVLHDSAMVRRFHAEPIVQATELLLQERMPRDVMVARTQADGIRSGADVRDLVPPVLRRFTSPSDPTPRTHVLSNGRYAVMVTAAGSGHSRWLDLAVSRWREDVTRDDWGTYLYIRDTQSGDVWSAGHQPTGVEADSYVVSYSEDRAEFSRRDGSIATHTSVIVSAEHDAEIRRVSLTNLGSLEREIELTSYSEIALAPQAADIAHPAFQNLFVQTEFVPEVGALLATRRPRSASERRLWAAHVSALEDHTAGEIQYETDRARFLGRGRSTRSPASVFDGRPLSNTVGAVLDPVFCLRRRIRLAPGTTARVTFSTLVGGSRDAVLDLADKYREPATFERAATLAWTQAQVQLRHLGIETDDAQLFQRLANRVIYSDPSLRPAPGLLAGNERGATGLWARGISGDLPIVVARIDGPDDLDLVRTLLRAHEYWRLKLLTVDLVIVNEHAASYAQGLQGELETLVRTSRSVLAHDGRDVGGGVHILRGDLLTPGDRTLLLTAARAVLLGRRGSLAEQVIRLEGPRRNHPAAASQRGSSPARAEARQPAARAALLDRVGGLAEQVGRLELPGRAAAAPPAVATPGRTATAQPPDLEAFNGLGGFSEDGREYVVVLGPGQATPAPWLNVVANPSFGFQVSESGSGYTWAENSRENQLTPWSNDPVSDPAGEGVYVRDEDSGELWGPTAQPIRCEGSTYVARHGPGYSRFEHVRDGIALELVQFVPLESPLKVSVLSIENRSGRSRRLSVTAYAEWALGTSRGAAAPYIITSREPGTGALLARNPWNTEFGSRVAFLDLGGIQATWTADRSEFLGRNGAPDAPLGLDPGHALSGSVGAGLDPCAVLQGSVELAPGERADVRILLGQAASASLAADLVRHHRAADQGEMLRAVADHWESVLGAVQVETPDRAMDIMLNSWLLYQTLACRMWARAACYQAGGAYGFRDQLQDAIALLTARPELAREHIVRAAGRQFPEGDVQHWWHPPSGRGVRTRISDDRLWLPYVVHRYLSVTDDQAILDERIPFIEGPAIRPDETDAYFEPEYSAEQGSLFEHCARAIDRSLAVGSHGLPLIGSGDWNDGMDRVGADGRGESVWLGWFLHPVLAAFSPIADARGEHDRATRWRAHAKALRRALERDGWDGDWYRRAFFDDGALLGSAVSPECRIDSIPQSWSVLSGAARPTRAERAMAAVEEHLVRRDDELVLLFTPPFDRSDLDPGYIKGYPPGVRENGGQYTHAAVWSVLARVALGHGDQAAELFAMLNPINHASTPARVDRYKVEPYVMAADVYAEPSHLGRGGWTWYTGSAGWMYQAGVEAILGFRLRGSTLDIQPCIPRAWRRYRIDFRYRSARYRIAVENPDGVSRGVVSVEFDGRTVSDRATAIPLVDDGATHAVRVLLG
jgi:cyclic beta-1,2-glucan synthetase